MIVTEKFESSSSDAVYSTQLNTETGAAECNCPGWTRGKKPGQDRICKHTKAIREHNAHGVVAAKPAAPVAVTGQETYKPVKPMLASAMTKGELKDYCNKSWVMEEKFDGERIIVRKTSTSVTAWSRPRAGTNEMLQKSLSSEMREAILSLPDGVFDGELLVPDGKSYDVRRLDKKGSLVLVLFDVVELFEQPVHGKPYADRREMLLRVVQHYTDRIGGGALIQAPKSQAVSKKAIDAIWARGGEGVILKRLDATYQPNKRSADWIKVKAIFPATMTIIGFEKGENGPYSKVKLRDKQCEATCKTKNNEWLRKFNENAAAYIGERLVITHYGLTPAGKYRGPIIWDHIAGEGE